MEVRNCRRTWQIPGRRQRQRGVLDAGLAAAVRVGSRGRYRWRLPLAASAEPERQLIGTRFFVFGNIKMVIRLAKQLQMFFAAMLRTVLSTA